MYDEYYGLSYSPLTSIQTTFVAGTVHLLDALQARQESQDLSKALRNAAFCVCSDSQ